MKAAVILSKKPEQGVSSFEQKKGDSASAAHDPFSREVLSLESLLQSIFQALKLAVAITALET